MGFRVIRDFGKDKDERGAVGIESAKPRHWVHSHMGVDMDSDVYLYKGGTIKVRAKDDDGNIYYHIYVDDPDFSCELAFDWATSYAGACALDIWLDDYEKLYGPPKYEQYVSKDKKWYAYMG